MRDFKNFLIREWHGGFLKLALFCLCFYIVFGAIASGRPAALPLFGFVCGLGVGWVVMTELWRRP